GSGTAPAADGGTDAPRSTEGGRRDTGAAEGGGDDHPLCVNGQSVDGEYPKVDYQTTILGTPPDATFDGESGKVSLHDYFEPCASQSRLLVVRMSAPWCGTCLWHLGHTGEIKALDVAARVEILDLLVRNRDNDPPAVADLAAFKA